MQDQIRLHSGGATLGFAALAVATSAGMAVATLLTRAGLGFPMGLLLSGIAIAAVSTLGPALWALRAPDRQHWVGPLAALLLIAACAIIDALGIIGIAVVCAAALACLVYAAMQLSHPDRRSSPTILALGCAIAVCGVLLFSLELGGTKYINFLVDQLILHGRADGDDYLNAALTKSMSSFLIPAPGIDGVAPAYYHVGYYALAAMLTDAAGGDAGLAMMALQMLVLVPILGFAVAHGAAIVGARLMPALQPRGLALAALAFVLVPIAQLSGIGNLVAHSTSMLAGGVLLTLVWPSFLAQTPASALGRSERMGRSWWIAAIAIPLLAVAKISVGYVWTAVVGYLALRRIGIARLGLWLLGLAMAILFFGSLYLFASTGGGGGKLFGTPFYVERGFAEGNYLLPLQLQWQSLAALAGLLLLRNVAAGDFRRMLIEALIVVILAANLPGLVMEVPGGDAAYFLIAGEWFALPVLILALAVAPALLGAAARKWRIAGWAAAAAAVAGLLVGLVDTVPLRANTFVSAEALVRTGDRGYFVDHKKRALKDDARRALDNRSLLALMRMPPVEPIGLKLADQLRTLRGEGAFGAIAFAAPGSGFWSLVGECDGKSLWPMAVAGVSMLAGHSASRPGCDEGPLLGTGLPDVALPAVPTQDELCALAEKRGFGAILVIHDVSEAPERVQCSSYAVSDVGQ
jgi:hypothetical protein